MQESVATLEFQLPCTPSEAVDEVLIAFPYLSKDREKILVVYQHAWRGEWPVYLITDISDLSKRVPWFKLQVQMLLGAIKLPEFSDIDESCNHYKRIREWESKYSNLKIRRPTYFLDLEGLLLLSRMRYVSKNIEYVHRLLGRVLDQVNNGLKSGGPGRRFCLRRHPLKDVLNKIGNPQTIEMLPHALQSILPETKTIYPRLSSFLEDVIIPLACGNPVDCISPAGYNEADILDTDKPPQSLEINSSLHDNEQEKAAKDSFSLLPVIKLHDFTVVNVPDEMVNYAKELECHKSALIKISKAWRGEETLAFYNAVGNIAHTCLWLPKVLKKSINPSVFPALRAISRNSRRAIYFRKNSAEWRERNYLQPLKEKYAAVTFESKHSNDSSSNLLRGLLLLGKIEWGASENVAQQVELENLIKLVKPSYTESYVDDVHKITWNPDHPIHHILKSIANTKEEISSAMKLNLPNIAKLDPDAANLLGQTYCPLLGIMQMEVFPELPIADEHEKNHKKRFRKKRKSRRSKVRELRINIPNGRVRLPGESIEETCPGRTILRRCRPSKKVIALKTEIQWTNQRIYGNNQLVIRNHIESLSDVEALQFVRALKVRISSAITKGDASDGWIGVLAALSLLTGQGIGTWATIEISLNDFEYTTHDKPRLILNNGIFCLPTVRPEGAFKPEDSMRNILEGTSRTINLRLPPSLCCLIHDLLKFGTPKWTNNHKKLKKDIEALVGDLEPQVGTGISLARIRNVARARIREASNDLASTMLLCGDTFGLSTAPLYYTSVNVTKLETDFCKSTWPLFGDRPISNSHANDKSRVGSELLVTTNAARELSTYINNSSNIQSSTCTEVDRLVKIHNNLVNHIIKMLMAAAGHRPTSAIFELKRFDFDTALHAAVFKDKQCDPAHLFRYVPTADMVSSQIEKYLDHLRVLVGSPNNNSKLVNQAQSALIGDGPLFFHLDHESKPFMLELNGWRKTLSTKWLELPLNWGRTWLASRGRDAGIDPDYLSIILGHLDASGYPFSKESPLEPAQLSRAVSGALGKLAKSSGWVPQMGLKPIKRSPDILSELGPLKNWSNERTQLAELTRVYEIEQRQVLRSALRVNRAEGEKIAIASLELFIKRAIPSFESFKLVRKDQSFSEPGLINIINEQEIKLTDENIEYIQNKIDESTSKDKILEIAAHNALYRYLKNARKKLNWECSIPSPWLAPATLEPTPFFPGIFKATNQLKAMRTHFGQIPVKVPLGGSFTAFEWACGQAIISLCLFGFNDDLGLILDILNDRESAVRNKTIKDLLLIETGEDRSVVGIRGLAAITIARLAKEFPNIDLPQFNRLNLVVAAQLPPAFRGNDGDVLTRLCATISVANIVELSGLARMSLNRTKGCKAMPITRQRQMLEEGYGLADDKSHLDAILDEGDIIDNVAMPIDDDMHIGPQKCASSVVRKQYRQLCEILYIGDGPKIFNITGVNITQANIVAFRTPLCNELTNFLKQDKQSQIIAYIAAFALHMTVNGTLNKKDPAWSTVYGYITSFGSDLVNLSSGLDFMNLDAEEFIDLYQDVIDRKSCITSRTIAARELVNFHIYLQKYHGFETVDFSDLEGVDVRSDIQVDAEVIQPQEYAKGLEKLPLLSSASDPLQFAGTCSLRANRQTMVFGLLMRYSGARHNELTALRFKDILATPDSIILLIRPSRYRRLKTSSARRIIEISNRMTRQQRVLVTTWINSEISRLDDSWKPTLPIFGKMGAPKERLSPSLIRNILLDAMEQSVGCRTKIHRARHLVVCEDMLAIWLSNSDWHSLIKFRKYTRRPIRGFKRIEVVLPRHIREHSLRIGHRRSSTTLINYFHMPWAMTSRAHQAIVKYADCHAAAVALGTGYSNAFKICYRSKMSEYASSDSGAFKYDAWLTHLIGSASPTPGASTDYIPNTNNSSQCNPLSGRAVERILRDVQNGLSPNEASLVHGLTIGQLNRLKSSTEEIQLKTGFKIWPINKDIRRSARSFQEAGLLVGILDLMDRDKSDPDRQLVLSVSHAYISWAWKSKRDKLLLPDHDCQRLSELLCKLGVSQTQVIVAPSDNRNGFSQIQVMRSQDPKKLLNHSLVWLLVVARIVEIANEP